MIIDLDDNPLEGTGRSPSSMERELDLPEDLWGDPLEGTGADGALNLELGAEAAAAENWWGPAEGDRNLLDAELIADSLEQRGADEPEVDAPLLVPRVAEPAQRRPALAPAPVAVGRWNAIRRSVDRVHVNRRASAAGLAVLVTAGLFLMVATRSSEEDGPRRQVATAGTQPVATAPASSVPRSTVTTVASSLPAAGPASVPGEASTTVVANGSSPPPTTSGQVPANRPASPATSATTAPARSNATVATSPPQNPPPPAPPATEAPVTTSAPPIEDPETPPTTRRPRVTIPDTTAVPNTTSSTTTLPPADE